MKDKKFVTIGFVALLLIVSITIFVVGAETQEDGKSHWLGKTWRGHWKGLDSGFDNKTSFSDNLREKFGLSENATEGEVREAIMQHRETRREEWKMEVKEKLGLPESASDEELQEALQKWREENKDLLSDFGHGKQRVHIKMEHRRGG